MGDRLGHIGSGNVYVADSANHRIRERKPLRRRPFQPVYPEVLVPLGRRSDEAEDESAGRSECLGAKTRSRRWREAASACRRSPSRMRG